LEHPSIDVNYQDEIGRSFIHIAALKGHEQTIRLLKELGADVNALIPGGRWTSAIFAAQEGNMSTIELLVSEGADISYLLENPIEGVDYESAIAAGQSFFDKKQSGKNEVESKITEIFARSISLTPDAAQGQNIDENVMRMIDSSLFCYFLKRIYARR